MPPRAAELIERLRLQPHPEGGWYAEVHRSAALTSIYFLLTEGTFSRWHRVASDELWCHVEGAPIELHSFDAAAREVSTTLLGPVSSSTQPQSTVPAGHWQAASSSSAYSLAACMVAPAFRFADFTLMAADDPLRDWLGRSHPALARY